ncbi:MAG TPA: DUF58 domain-containing protein, partial [Thiothrix sp.]|nr:DUF58 domain-containing protein [Thiothrix sp.]
NKSSIFIGWKDEDLAEVNLHQEESSQHNNPHTQRIKLSHSTSQRGYFKAPRLSIFSRYPIGLIISWSYAALDIQSIVFPEPILQKNADNGIGKDDQAEQGKDIANGSTDFSGIREYQTGDSPKQIHWGTYAKTGELHTKSFIDYASNDLWLEWSNLKLQGVEPKLSHLSARVLECHQLQLIYGLKLPTTTLQPNNGEAHKIACLTALALYGLDSKQRN